MLIVIGLVIRLTLTESPDFAGLRTPRVWSGCLSVKPFAGTGASAPTIAAALYNATKSSDAIVGYVVAMSVISAISVTLLPDPWRRPTAVE